MFIPLRPRHLLTRSYPYPIPDTSGLTPQLHSTPVDTYHILPPGRTPGVWASPHPPQLQRRRSSGSGSSPSMFSWLSAICYFSVGVAEYSSHDGNG
ncbi:hypothetical protein GYMLUDRAFT_599794 [Collybiopsis luxurians FD-317 M1]|uniref:Uncharacterized protein n=1 Tax=Collybiopsis luxurians FD-317 M1 TaxID=944289 RepID=A0A0D0C4R6_9AGAR|nr:hypothetical protein GYMLUDRAFT_599794 [Collybiopsis luxurians FD-317 M1]